MRTLLVSMLLLAAIGCEDHRPASAPVPDPAVDAQAIDAEAVDAQAVDAGNGLKEPPDAYLDLHGTLYRTDSPEWAAVVARLKTSGDLFTVHVSEALQRKKLADDRKALLTDLSAAIKTRYDAESLGAAEALRLLEVAAYADVTCHAVEHPLRKWTLAHVARFASAPAVRAELERIESSYRSALPSEGRDEVLDISISMRVRIREYAGSLLGNPPHPK
jgi:hypothetical protein